MQYIYDQEEHDLADVLKAQERKQPRQRLLRVISKLRFEMVPDCPHADPLLAPEGVRPKPYCDFCVFTSWNEKSPFYQDEELCRTACDLKRRYSK